MIRATLFSPSLAFNENLTFSTYKRYYPPNILFLVYFVDIYGRKDYDYYDYLKCVIVCRLEVFYVFAISSTNFFNLPTLQCRTPSKRNGVL